MARTADKLISDIRKEVSSGTLKPGDQLEVAALAERFGVEPETEDRDMSEEELDNLLEGFNEDDNGPDTKYEIKIQYVR